MDLQTGMLARVRKKAQDLTLNNIAFLHVGIGEGKLDSNYFDRALMVAVLGEIPNQQIALEEVYHTLKPGGILSITEIIFDPHFHRQSTVKRLAEKVGFRYQETFGRWYAYTMHLEKPNR